MNKISKHILIFFITAAILNLSGCSYSFSGASIPPHLKTIAIPILVDRSGSGEQNLGEKLTDKLIRSFIDDNSLTVADKLKSDSILDGSIISLNDSPAVVTGGESISSRRLTITVKVTFKDLVKHVTVFDRNFSNYSDYQTGGDILSAREKAIDNAINKISEDILLGVVSNW